MGTFKKSRFSDLQDEVINTPTKLFEEVDSKLLGDTLKAAVRAGCLISFGSARFGNAYISIFHNGESDKFALENPTAIVKKLKGIMHTSEEMAAESEE